MKDDPVDLSFWKARELLAGSLSPATGVTGNHYEHDFDEELGMYWYGDSVPTSQPTPKAASIVRVSTSEQWRALQQARGRSDK